MDFGSTLCFKRAVLTVPASFSKEQREATRQAAEAAGLTVLQIIDEPTSAAISYWLHREVKDGRILVYDLGGGTFDVSIVQVRIEIEICKYQYHGQIKILFNSRVIAVDISYFSRKNAFA